MDILNRIKTNKKLYTMLLQIGDIEIYDDLKNPNDMNGEMIYNIEGKAFGCDGSGGEFVLLCDGTVAWNSSGGETGRISENVNEFFLLLINCPAFQDFLVPDLYSEVGLLEKYTLGMIEKERKRCMDNNSDWDLDRNEIAMALGLTFDPNNLVVILRNFFKTATREPQYQYSFISENQQILSECLISRPIRDWVYEVADIKK